MAAAAEPTLVDWITARHEEKACAVVVLCEQEPDQMPLDTAIDQELSVLPNTAWAWKTNYRLHQFRKRFPELDHQRSKNVSERGVSFPRQSIVVCREYQFGNFEEGVAALTFNMMLDETMTVFIFRVTKDTLEYARRRCANFPVFHLRRRIDGPVDGNAPAAAGGVTTNACLVAPGLPVDV